jgi:hypothetical protein
VFKVYADGSDIFTTLDHCQFIYKYITNDFDLAVRLESLLVTDPAAKAGLIARDVPNPDFVLFDDRDYMAAAFTADPARNNNFSQFREASGGNTVAPAAPRPGATYPNNWLRLKRIGSRFEGYSGPNGWDWSPMTPVDSSTNVAGAYPETIRVGIAVTAHNAAATTEAIFSQFGPAHERAVLTGAPSGGNLVLRWQPATLGAMLQTTTNLNSPIIWANVPGSTSVTNVSVPIGPGNQFFRLSQ